MTDRPAVVINADDLGRSLDVNRAILAAFDRGLITSATIMANMPGFEQAAERIHATGLADRIGVHLNLTEGRPLTAGIVACPRLCDPDGVFRPRRGSAWRLSRDEARAINDELDAQVRRAAGAGIVPTHLDSHQHVHTQWPILSITIGLAHAHGIPAVRLSRNCGRGRGWMKRVYKTLANERIARAGLARTRYFGGAGDVETLQRMDGSVEVMVHPELGANGELVDVRAGAGRTAGAPALASVTDRWRSAGSLVSYRELATG